jgi:hypothetical protein
MVAQLWDPITPKNPKDGGDMFSETSVRTRVTWCKVLEGINDCPKEVRFIVTRCLD